MLAGEKMDRTEFSVSMKLSQIQAMRMSMNLEGLEFLGGVASWSDLDAEELRALISSYEYVFKCMNQEQAGEHRAS